MLFLIFAVLIAVLDQMFKFWVSMELISGGEIVLIPKLIHLTYLENTGAAFSIFSNMRWVLVGLSSVCVVLLVVVLLSSKGGFLSKISLAAVIGGASGNLADRILTGKVIDMFEFDFIHFAVFNIADIFITVGGLVFCLCFILGDKNRRGDKNKTKPAEADVRHSSVPEPIFELSETGLTETSILEEFDFERRLGEFDDKA